MNKEKAHTFTLLRRVIYAGFVGFYRNRTVSLSSIFILTITLCIIATFFLFSAVFNYTLNNITERVDVKMYFTVEATDAQVEEVKAKVLGLPQVAKVVYTNREEALSQFKERHNGDQLTLQALDELGTNPFGASLSIIAKDTTQYEAIAKAVAPESNVLGEAGNAVDKVNYFQLKNSIDTLNNIIGWVNKVGFWISLIFLIMSCMIVYNTIRLAIFVFRDEIAVMKLVGASNMYIRGPFIVESILYGLSATAITLIVMYPATLWIARKTVIFFEGLNINAYYLSHLFSLAGVLLLFGVLLSVISSLLAVRKYLNV